MANAFHNQYLHTLGIVHYVPRELPLVSIVAQPAAEPVASSPPAIAIAADSEPVSKSVSSAAESREAMAKSMAELGNIGTEDKSKASRVKLAEPVAVAEPLAVSNIEVKFALWQPTDEVLVCSSVEDSLPDPEQILLLGNILEVMGQGAGQLPQMDIVEWPPYPNASGDSGEVREFLETLIRARINSKSAKILLLMGDAASLWLLTADEKAAVANGQVNVYDQVTALLVPSLKEMIEQPASKRKTWQTIRFLSPQRHVYKAQS
ncbi:MAG: hypothetical protein P8M77_05610 [Porticoccaceae bacterium]|nr:hypothetical protein [Porticoccaceae bacterium]